MDEKDDACEGHTHLNEEVASVDFSINKPQRIFIMTTDHNPKAEALAKLQKAEPKMYDLLKDKFEAILSKSPISGGTETCIFVCTKSHEHYRVYLGIHVQATGATNENETRTKLLMEGSAEDVEEGLVNMQINEIRMSSDPDWHGTRRVPQTFEGETALAEARKIDFFNKVFTEPEPVLSPLSESIKKAKLSPEKRASLVAKYGEAAIKELEDRQKKGV